MSEETPGSSSSVQLVQNPNQFSRKNLELCIICQRTKDKNGSKKLTSAEKGRETVIKTSEKLDDGKIAGIEPCDLVNIQYHVDTCYGAYKKKGERCAEKQKRKVDGDEPDISPNTSPANRTKRSKPSEPTTDLQEKPCIICGHVKFQGVKKKSRVEEAERADCLMKAARFNKDDVYTRMIFMKEIGDVFASDVMYHQNCIRNYLLKFERAIEKILSQDFGNTNGTNIIKETFMETIETITPDSNGYALSDIRDIINKKLHDKNQGKFF